MKGQCRCLCWDVPGGFGVGRGQFSPNFCQSLTGGTFNSSPRDENVLHHLHPSSFAFNLSSGVFLWILQLLISSPWAHIPQGGLITGMGLWAFVLFVMRENRAEPRLGSASTSPQFWRVVCWERSPEMNPSVLFYCRKFRQGQGLGFLQRDPNPFQGKEKPQPKEPQDPLGWKRPPKSLNPLRKPTTLWENIFIWATTNDNSLMVNQFFNFFPPWFNQVHQASSSNSSFVQQALSEQSPD